jgi:DNA-binding NtrC family response regulator
VEAHTVLLIATPNESADAHQQALQDAGMAVLRAKDGLTGMRDALGEQPDAVVLDFSADDAPDVLRARRALREAGIPLLVLVDGEIAAGDDAADAATITFLRTPVEPGRLVAETTRAVEAAAPFRKRARDGAPRT